MRKVRINLEKLKQNVIKLCAEKHQSVDLDNPKSFTDKMHWLKVYDISELKAKCADKVLVHEYVEEKLGEDICVPIYKVWDDPKEINWDELPYPCVVKCNHGYAMNLIIPERKKVNYWSFMFRLYKWMNKQHGNSLLEKHYNYIDRKVFCEQFLTDGVHTDIPDYKFFCYNGKPTFVQVVKDRHNKNRHLNYYDMDFNFVDISEVKFKNNPNELDEKPVTFEKMKEYAAKLSEDFKFVRVDFYEVNNKVYLGELTFTPDGGYTYFVNEKDNLYLGSLLDINKEPKPQTNIKVNE